MLLPQLVDLSTPIEYELPLPKMEKRIEYIKNMDVEKKLYDCYGNYVVFTQVCCKC